MAPPCGVVWKLEMDLERERERAAISIQWKVGLRRKSQTDTNKL